MKSLHLHSFIIGVLATALVLSLMGAVHYLGGDANGRFQIAANEGWVLMVDTASGQVWAEHSHQMPSPLDDPNSEFRYPKLTRFEYP